MTRLAGKVALITGGGTGIGRGCALAFAREGARVAVAGRQAEPLSAVAAEIYNSGGEALAVACDVTRAADIERTIQLTLARFGKLNVVVNNAGVLVPGNAEETSEAHWDQVLGINLKGTFLVSRAALHHLREAGGGSIINIGSILSLVGMPRRVAYAASKGGVMQLTKAMALDHAHENIRVNCICPAIVDTPLIKELAARQPDPEAFRRSRAQQIPIGRMGKPEDVASLAVFLASDESSWLTGASLPLDGGFTAA